MKNLKELKNLLENIKVKGYALSGSTLIDYDIKQVIEKNLENFRREVFNKYNTLGLKTDNLESFKIYKDDKYKEFKEFEEIENEIKKHFSSRGNDDLLKELLSDLHLSYNYRHSDLCEENFETIKETIENEHKKELVLSNYYDYSLKNATEENIIKFTKLVNVVLNLNVKIDLSNLGYSSTLNEVQEAINNSQDVFKVRLFLNKKMKIKFKDSDNFEEVKKVFVKKAFKHFKKEFFVKVEEYTKEEIKDFNGVYFAEIENKLYVHYDINFYELQELKKSHKVVSKEETKDFRYVTQFNKSDVWRVSYMIDNIEKSNLSNEYKRTAQLITNHYFKGVVKK